MNEDIATVRFLVPVSAGFSSPSEDWKKQTLNLHDLVVKHSLSTFFMRIARDSMIGVCLHARGHYRV